MSTDPTLPEGSVVEARLAFLKPDKRYDNERPYFIVGRPPPGIKQSNIEYVHCKTRIHDARNLKNDFSLCTNGFEWLTHELYNDVASKNDIDRYMDEMAEVARKHLGASRVHVYDFVVRRSVRYARDVDQPRPEGVDQATLRANCKVHTDIAPNFGVERLKQLFPDQWEHLIKKKFKIIGIWRPLAEPVQTHPLALCDFQSLDKGDQTINDLVYPHAQVETTLSYFNPSQRWWFLDRQMKNEVLIMQAFDSESPVQCLHAAFEDPRSRSKDARRQSIELRCFAFF
ncbi:hypothetical protein K504DRAFT_522381 [Pleomassaria siparia CBS 279.74]|uniref:Methyltransferase n=1 Tax=Pleomassaria siparia CBS 279.74 TaxID=1314801 RepID=A0A6G1JQ96_9PLEO|nr:hypothetical protein K504DRAFT_522381 [Pleomassaria siparia CBS 279.74]